MSNRNVPFFRDYLRVLGACVSYAETARRLNLSDAWIFKCLAASKAASGMPEVPSVFLFEEEEGDNEPRWFHDHVRSAISNSIEAIEAAARSRALHGTLSPALYKGVVQYQLDPAKIGFDDATLEMIYSSTDRYLRDAKGFPLVQMVKTEPSTDLVLGILGAHSKRYRKANAGTTVNVSSQSGVQVIERRKPELPAPLPVLENVTQADFAEVADGPPSDEPDLTVTGTDPNEPPVSPAPLPEDRVEPVTIREPTPPQYASAPAPILTPRRSLSSDELALLARLPVDNSTVRAAPKSRTREL